MILSRIFLLPLGVLFLFCLLGAVPAHAQYTLLLPDQPTQEATGKDTKKQMDVLLALGDPFSLTGLDMDMPQLFAVLRHVPLNEEEQAAEERNTGKRITVKAVREDLLGELEEIRYLDKQAWAAHVGLHTPGLYQLMAETRPRWDDERSLFEQQFVKVVLPVHGSEKGWDTPGGLTFEILPLTRPFGLSAPALFTGKVLLGPDALPDAFVRIVRLNTEKRGVPSPWHAEHIVKTDSAGYFSFLCPQPGWWAFMAITHGAPMKGSDGQAKPLELGAVLWIYVDDAKLNTHKPPKVRSPQP